MGDCGGPHSLLYAPMTISELQDMMIKALVLSAGGTKQRWRTAIGPVQLHDRATHSHCNWSVHPSGTLRDNAEIERLLDTVRLDHPVIDEN